MSTFLPVLNEGEKLEIMEPKSSKSSRKSLINVAKQKPSKLTKTKELTGVQSTTKIIDISSHFADVFQNLHKLQLEGKFCDALIKIKEEYIAVHRLVLVASSPYFHRQFDTINCDNNIQRKCIDLSHIPVWVTEEVVSFLYTGKLQILETKLKEFTKYCQDLEMIDLCKELGTNKGNETDIEHKERTETEKIVEATNNGKQLICENGDTNSSTLSHLKKLRQPATNTHHKEENSKLGKHKTKLKLNKVVKSESEKQKQTKNRNFHRICKGGSSIQNKESNEYSSSSTKTNVDIELELPLLADQENSSLKKKLKRRNCSKTKTVIVKTESNALINSQSECDMYYSNDELKSDKNEHTSSLSDDDTVIDEDFNEDINDSDKDFEDSEFTPEDESEFESKPKKLKLSRNLKKSSVKANTNRTKIKHKSNGKFANQCKNCEDIFTSEELLSSHKKVCKGNRPRKRCILCQITFDTAEEYIIHRDTDKKCLDIRQQKHETRLKKKAQSRSKFGCQICPRKFRRVADQIDHEFVTHDIPYDKEKWPELKCEWCSYWTMNPWRLHHHVTYDCSKGQEFICDVCGNKYKNEKTLKCHREMMHTDSLPMMTCEQCGKTLKGPKGLEHHIRIMHKGENPHKRHMCHICSMKYSSSNDLTFHLHKAHQQPLPDTFLVYECPHCDYVINNKRTYNKHLMLHEDKRDWKCEKCPKAFKTRNSLHTHMKSHLGQKMPCPYEGCGYAALKNCHLKTHIENQHTQKGVKNEECHMCNYSTFFKGNLIKHLRTVHHLEVVTRYSVQMKAKYKHLKTGQIVGQLNTDDQPVTQAIQKNKKHNNSSAKQYTASKAKLNTQQKQLADGQLIATPIRSMNVSKFSQVGKINDEGTITNETIDNQVRTSNKFAPFHTLDPLTNIVSSGPQSTINPSLMYPMCEQSIQQAHGNVTNLNVIYCTPQNMATIPRQPNNLVAPDNQQREINMTIPSMYDGKVISPGEFQSQVANSEDEVMNAAKMLTYYQM